MSSLISFYRPRSDSSRVGRMIYFTLWSLFLLLAPFYLFPSGLPQPANFIMVGLMGLLFLAKGVYLQDRLMPAVQLLAAFVGYVFAVNLVYACLTSVPSLIVNSTYYLYNFLAFLSVLILFSHYGRSFSRLTLHLLFGAVVIQVLLSFFVGTELFRQNLFFNNPNQLGYYALLSMALFSYLSRHLTLEPWYQIAFYLGAIYLVVISLSKAALLGILMLIALLFFKRPRVALWLAGLVVLGLLFTPPGQELQQKLTRRADTVQADDDLLVGRGYDRILHHPGRWLLGAGEGAFGRFDSVLTGREMHSSWGTLFFSYGLVGSALFCGFLLLVVRQGGFAVLVHLLPVFLYGLTHNGLRFTPLWLLLAFMACTPQLLRARSAGPP